MISPTIPTCMYLHYPSTKGYSRMYIYCINMSASKVLPALYLSYSTGIVRSSAERPFCISNTWSHQRFRRLLTRSALVQISLLQYQSLVTSHLLSHLPPTSSPSPTPSPLPSPSPVSPPFLILFLPFSLPPLSGSTVSYRYPDIQHIVESDYEYFLSDLNFDAVSGKILCGAA